LTRKEDIFINELFEVGLGIRSIDDTDHLKKVCTKSKKVKNIVEDLKGSSASRIVKDLMLAQCQQINLNYEEFLLNPKLPDKCLLNNSEYWRKKYDSEKTKNLDVFYKEIYSLYDSQDTLWLKELVDLKVILEEMNREENKYICPICQAQLDGSFEKDHFLPRSIFPTLTISSLNFTPICATCNSASYKGESAPKLPIIIPNKCNPIEEYITFKYNKYANNFLLHRYGYIDLSGGTQEPKREVQLTTKDFGEIFFEDFYAEQLDYLIDDIFNSLFKFSPVL